jgi:hypothetical protein
VFFRTTQECREVAEARGLILDPVVKGGLSLDPTAKGLNSTITPLESVQIDLTSRKLGTYTLAKQLVAWFGPTRHCLLWITEFGIWDANLHLYYKLRQSYGDHRALFEAPGHAFLSHEESDLISFLDLALQFGWGGFLFGTPNESYLTISHDEWVVLETEDLTRVVKYLEDVGLPYKKIDRPNQRVAARH